MMNRRFAVAGLLIFAACKSDPTQLVVAIDSDYRVPAELGVVRAQVTDQMGALVSQQDFTLVAADAMPSPTEVHLPFSFGIVPVGQDASRIITVTAIAFDPSGKTLVSRRATTGFVKSQSRLLYLFLARACETRAAHCTSDQTCTETGCASPNMPPDQLPAATPGQDFPPRPAQDAEAAPPDAEGPPRDAATGEDAPLQTFRDAMVPSPDTGFADGPPLDVGSGMDVPNPDATNPDAQVDAGPMCPATGNVCSGACPTCTSACGTCNQACAGSCNETCQTGSNCNLDVNGADQGSVTCEPGATCSIACRADEFCTMNCMGSSPCIMTNCHQFQRDGGPLQNTCHMMCTTTATTCQAGSIVVCNRGCP